MSLAETARGVSFTAGLALYLRDPHTPERARAIVRTRLARREQNFLALAKRAIYADRSSLYLTLLRHAGCELGDLAGLVLAEGLEGALAELYRRGVYLSHPELMGAEPVQRGSLRMTVSLARLRSRQAIVPGEPTGPGARPAPRLLHHAMFSGMSAHAISTLDLRQALRWRHGLWSGPAPPTVHWLSRLTVRGQPPPVCFSRYDPAAPDLPIVARRLARVVPAVSRLTGSPIPAPVHAEFDRPTPILDWIRREFAAGNTPHLTSNISMAVAVAEAARESGTELAGAQFSVSAEAVTPGRRDAIVGAGGTIYPSYGAKESGMIAHGCLKPKWSDEMHVLTDCHALIQAADHGHGASLPEDALLITSLQQWWPIVLLNVSLGDRADFLFGSCGCPLERPGWRTRLHTVRSFARLKVGGEPLPIALILTLLERTLPEQFGGGPLSYQLVQEDAQVVHGLLRLTLVVDPSVGEIDEEEIVQVVGQALTATGAYLPQFRQRSGWIAVERRRPYPTPSGKILQLCHRSATSDTLVAEAMGV